MNIDPNDPRLTAYALGELDENERAEIEAQVKQSEALRQAVDGIRETAELLTEELKTEPAPRLLDAQRRAIQAKAAQSNGQDVFSQPQRSVIRRFWIPASLAASLLIVVAAGYTLLPLSFEAARRSPEMVCSESVKGVGTSARLYEITSPTGERFYDWTADQKRRFLGPREKGKEYPSVTMEPRVVFRSSGGISYGIQVPFGPRDTRPREGMDNRQPIAADRGPWYLQPGFNTESYNHIVENPFLLVTQNPLSTFSIDVDTASYANVRRFLNQGMLPPPGAVRIEEMINYFDYDYPLPTGDDPFSVNVEVVDCPWEPDHLLAKIGLKGQEFEEDERPPANLVFLLDVSGSMQPVNKLPLLRQAMSMLAQELTRDDYVAIVVYAGASGLVLPSTSCEDKGTILAALDRLHAGGSTNGGAGIQLAYDTAIDNFIEGGINRVILATDGDFNVGTTNQSDLIRLIEEKAKSGVFLSVLGFGMGNLKDSTLEKLADKGNGNYAYIDTLNEARKVLVDQMGGTLVTIAKDVKIQIEFNPAEATAYRLIGYENRLLRAEDFNDDTKDAGEIGAGHTVTALYEIVPTGVDVDLPDVDPSKYQTSTFELSSSDETPRGLKPAAQSGELMTVKLRYKEPAGESSKLLEVAVTDAGLSLADASDDFVFAAAVASFGMLLRGSEHVGDFTYEAALEMAEASMGEDSHGYREEFVRLAKRAIELQPVAP